MTGRRTSVVEAAGAVLWRGAPDSDADAVEIAVIHRPRYDDWSLPKGKVDPGETAAVAAVREIAEETGASAILGRRLDAVEYPMPGRAKTKRVQYWAAEAQSGGDFRPNDEVDELLWLPPAAAQARLRYPLDRRVLADFLRLPATTDTTVVVRHAKAGSRATYSGDDRLRPLEPAGAAQAQELVQPLMAFGAKEVHAADPVRCVETVRPLAAAVGTDVIVEHALSETAYAADPLAAEIRLRELTEPAGRVICSQGKVIPHVLRALADQDGLLLPPYGNRKGSYWVLSSHRGTLVAADYYSGP
ncbi:MAG: NUDIX hydrolase [Mycobacteriaceae bacterium]|nr:NUDIX hydrolase [Mycobacteriaceae bacterium]